MLSIYLFKDKKNRLAMIAFFSLGFIISLLLFHFCIKDLTELYREVIHSSQQLMGASRGYSAKDHLFRLGFYLRDFFIIFCLMTGLFTLSKYVSDRRKNLAWLVFGLGFIIFMFYQKKPPLYMTLVLSSFFVVYFVKHFKNIHNFKNFDSIQYLFFLLLPLLSIMGTNTPYAGKMAFFMPLWGVLFCEIYKNRFMKGAAIISLVLAMLLPSFFSASRTAKTQYHYANYEGPARGMFLDNKQNAFFEKVDGLLKEYGYVPQKDYMFTTIGSQMTICIFDAKPCGIFQQPADFLMYANKNKLTRPDFLILNEWDLNQMAAVFDSIGWNFSNGYDKSFVGSPDNNEDKWLFCAKERKNQYIKKYGK
ncbi:hypothetical protein FACS18945_6110 [Bacteroidia bacterium]|nr:hypothetical protein FACS18945_6110 [Bacteroidia bacterium]